VDWLYEQGGMNTSDSVQIEPFMAETGIDLQTAFNLVRDAAERHLVLNRRAMSSPSAVLTPAGVRVAQERQHMRTDPALRAAAARTGLLRWLYEQEHIEVHTPIVAGILDSGHATFAGARLTAAEIDRAAQYLHEKKLIRGIPTAETRGPVGASLTTEGVDCVEQHGGNVTDYLNQRDRASNTFNIGTFNNAGATAFGGDANQHITSGVDPAAMASFVQTLLPELPKLPLDNDGQAGSWDALREAQQELARPEPDQGRISAAFQKFVGYISDAGKPALTALLVALARQQGLTP
jgi:hypothetical protein